MCKLRIACVFAMVCVKKWEFGEVREKVKMVEMKGVRPIFRVYRGFVVVVRRGWGAFRGSKTEIYDSGDQ